MHFGCFADTGKKAAEDLAGPRYPLGDIRTGRTGGGVEAPPVAGRRLDAATYPDLVEPEIAMERAA